MRKNLLLASFFTIAGLIFFHPLAYTNYNGLTSAGYAGAPGENNCTKSCHGSYPVNSGTGKLTIKILDNQNEVNEYVAGKTYTVEVNMTHSGAKGFGFQTTVKSKNTDAGLISTGGNPQVKKTLTGNYITHANPDAHHAGMDQWTFEWTAPSHGTDEVTFYTAGNAANLNFSPAGDYIYTSSKTLQPASSGIADEDSVFNQNLRLYPNPVQRMLMVEYTVQENQFLQETALQVFTLEGKLIFTENHVTVPVLNTVYLDCSGFPKGIYLLKLNAAGKTAVKKVFKQ